MSALTAGATLRDGRYRLDSVVGRGGMALVWRATDLQLERAVAIKVIADVLAGDPTFVARFEREARLAAALNHPNLVKVFDYSVEDERPFLVMEYIAGGTLAEARTQLLDVDSLARELLDAVAHIHAAGTLHRDIKPANVLLDASGSPRLTDFGIARGDETSALTQTGQVLGTLRFIAPEVARGERATVKSDLYSLGVLLNELGGTPSEPLRRLIPRLAAADPANRPESATEAMSELDETERADEAAGPDSTTRPVEPAELPPTEPLEPRKPHSQLGSGVFRRAAVPAALLLVALAAVVIALVSGGGGSSTAGITRTTPVQPAPAGAPVDRQLDQLERIIRAAPGRQ